MPGKQVPLAIILQTVDRATTGLRQVQGRVGDLERANSRLQRKIERLGRTKLANLQRGFKSVAGSVRHIVGGLSSLAGAAGFAILGRQVREFEDGLQRVGSQARFTKTETRALARAIDETSLASGQAREKLLAGLGTIVDLRGGSAATALNLRTLNTALLGTGAGAEDISRLMFAMGENLGVADDAMLGVLSGLDRIGAEKSIPFKEMAADFGPLLGLAKKFGAEGAEGAAEMAAAMQVLAPDFKGTAELATGLQGAMTALLKKEKKLKKEFKLDIRDENKQLRNLFEIMQELSGNKKIQKAGLINVLGRSEGARAIEGTVTRYKEFLRLRDLFLENPDFLGQRAAERMESTVGRLDIALNKARQRMIAVFTPERIEKFTALMEKLADGVEFMADNIGLVATGFLAVKAAAGLALGTVNPLVAGLLAAVAAIKAIEHFALKDKGERIGRKVSQRSLRRSLVGEFSGGRAGYRAAQGAGIVSATGAIDRAAVERSLIPAEFAGSERGRSIFRAAEGDKLARETDTAIANLRRGQRAQAGFAAGQALSTVHTANAKVLVEFIGAPPGTRTSVDPTSDADVDVGTGVQVP